MNFNEWLDYEIAELEHEIAVEKYVEIKLAKIQLLSILKDKKKRFEESGDDEI